MNLRKSIFNSLICLAMAATATAGELPAAYTPFKKLLGEWTGTVELEVRTAEGVEKFKNPKTSKCEFDEKRGAIVMTDSDTNPWTKEKVETRAEIRWDESSKCFKAIGWATDGGVQLVVIEQKGRFLHFRRVDSPPGDRYESDVSINDEGKLLEKGKTTFLAPSETTIAWTTVYEKPVK